MKIKSMTATYGRLAEAPLVPGPGLAVLTAPHEAGKSTWCAFLKAMLYGLDTRERDKSGSLAEKNRYQPWSGAPMAGTLELEWGGRDITLRRYSTKSGPFQGFEAVYTASGDPVPGLTAANAGHTLLGVSREVFVRSAFLAQDAATVTSAPELERRVASLATAGQEDASFSATQRVLRDWRNRRQANRTTGLIPQLERELAQVQARLEEMEQARTLRSQARQALERLEREDRALEEEAEIHRRLARRDLNRRYTQALADLPQAEKERASLPDPDPAFAGLTPQQARERARQEQEQYQAAVDNRSQIQTQREAAREGGRREARVAVILAVILAAVGITVAVLDGLGLVSQIPSVVYSFFLSGTVLALLWRRRAGKAARRRLEALLLPDLPQPEDWIGRAQAYTDWLARQERLEDEVRHCQERVDDLRAQGGQEADTLDYLHPPSRTLEETQRLLEQTRRDAVRWQSQLDQATGALNTDPLELEARQDELQRQLEARTLELEALNLALEGLEAANNLLRERFSPALNQRATEIFSALTDGSYDRLSLNRDFSALAGQGASALPRSALYLSAGTVDQLYLAVRLALCQLTLPDAPLVLDDALNRFDDQRATLALDYLLSLSRERQILLFTCHSREARWAAAHRVPVFPLN